MNERIRELRKKLNLSMEKFGEHLGVTRSAVSLIESGKNNVTDQMSKLICKEFNVDPYWLETGEGNMFIELSEDDELSLLVYDSLTDRSNPFFRMILATVKSYRQLSPENQTVLHNYLESLIEYLQENKENEKDE